jgi:hypothetical protein
MKTKKNSSKDNMKIHYGIIKPINQTPLKLF